MPARPPEPPPALIPRWLVILIVAGVFVMWIGSVIYSGFNQDWPVPPSIHALVILVVTGVMGVVTATYARKNGGGRG